MARSSTKKALKTSLIQDPHAASTDAIVAWLCVLDPKVIHTMRDACSSIFSRNRGFVSSELTMPSFRFAFW